jgi:hypothetical protein
VRHPSLSSLGPIVLTAAFLGACAAGGVGEGEGDFSVEQAGDDAGVGDAAPSSSSGDPGYASDASAPAHAADASNASTGEDGGGFPQPTGSDAGSAPQDSGGTYHDASVSHDSGSTQSGCAAPDTASSCTACMTANETCQNNGCYGGYYCDPSTSKCYAQSSCP